MRANSVPFDKNFVTTMRLPLSSSAGRTSPTSASIICSQLFVDLGITKPNSKLSSSICWSYMYMVCTISKFWIAFSEKNSIVRPTALHSSIFFGNLTVCSSSMDVSHSLFCQKRPKLVAPSSEASRRDILRILNYPRVASGSSERLGVFAFFDDPLTSIIDSIRV